MNIALLIIYLVGAVVAMILQIRVNIKANDSETKQTKFDFFSSVFIAGIMSLFYIFVYYMESFYFFLTENQSVNTNILKF